MKKFFSLFLLIISITSSWGASMRQVSQNEALEIAKSHFENKDVDYYLISSTGEESKLVWQIFVDAEPTKGWEHDCYIISVSRTVPMLGNTTPLTNITKHKIPPYEDLTPLETKSRGNDSKTHMPKVNKSQASNLPSNLSANTYALIISGGINKNSNYKRYWNDCSFIYQTLRNKYNVPKTHIFPLMADGTNPAADTNISTLPNHMEYISQNLDLDGDKENDIEYAATSQNIDLILSNLLPKMAKNDHLFIYVIDHGGTIDHNHTSFIYLWGNDLLYDYELADKLTPFIQKSINVNVILGQCYAGGFIDNLRKEGCVVATACRGDQMSSACPDRPYDEFVYHWTCAINEANHWGSKIKSDVNNDGYITMDEAFQYAYNNDFFRFEDPQSISREDPQYESHPVTIGEELAFNHQPPLIDLYIKDNVADTGKEPNITTDKNWISPSIWVRNEDDGKQVHENPIFSYEHDTAYIYVKVHNRGKENYSGGTWFVHVYWSRASAGFTSASWKGKEYDKNGIATGGHLSPAILTKINAGDSCIVKIPWKMPSSVLNSLIAANDGKHHFCLLARIMNTGEDDGYESGKKYFDVLASNDQAQKNISLISRADLSTKTGLIIRNVTDEEAEYSIELVPRTEDDSSIFQYSTIEMDLNLPIFDGWTQGGFKGHNINWDSTLKPRKVEFTSADSRLEGIHMKSYDFDKVKLYFNFKKNILLTRTYTLDLIQRDKSGNIIGGETFVIETPHFSTTPIEITPEPYPGGIMSLSTNAPSSYNLRWMNSNNETIGYDESVLVTPTANNTDFSVAALSPEGELDIQSISLDNPRGFKNIYSPDEYNSTAYIIFKEAVDDNTVISISPVSHAGLSISEHIPTGVENYMLDTSMLPSGIYILNLSIDNIIIDSFKFNKK